MDEIIFLAEEKPTGVFTAKALGVSIFSEADSYENLKSAVKDGVRSHFNDNKKRTIHLHIGREEILHV